MCSWGPQIHLLPFLLLQEASSDYLHHSNQTRALFPLFPVPLSALPFSLGRKLLLCGAPQVRRVLDSCSSCRAQHGTQPPPLDSVSHFPLKHHVTAADNVEVESSQEAAPCSLDFPSLHKDISLLFFNIKIHERSTSHTIMYLFFNRKVNADLISQPSSPLDTLKVCHFLLT